MVLRLGARVVDERACVRRQAAHRDADVRVHLRRVARCVGRQAGHARGGKLECVKLECVKLECVKLECVGRLAGLGRGCSFGARALVLLATEPGYEVYRLYLPSLRTSKIFSTEPGSCSTESNRFSTAMTMPSCGGETRGGRRCGGGAQRCRGVEV